jgi:alpha,alpha-trehalase
MCWAALDRGILLAQEHGLDAPIDRWHCTREQIRRAILECGFDARRGAFTQAFGSAALDASVLAIPRIGFLPATDPRVGYTVDHVRAELTRRGLVYRYQTEDGLPGREATFALCTFWLVDALALAGRLDEAHSLFERVVGFANDVGLLSEEVHASCGALLGNFPQGYPYAALISTAVNLSKVAKHGPEEMAETKGSGPDERTGPPRRIIRHAESNRRR